MKSKLLLIFIGIILSSCKNSEKFDKTIKGSWYNYNQEEKTYEEIHIDDSLFIYCYDNCDVIIPFNFYLMEDSIFLFSNKENIEVKYQISFNNNDKREMFLLNKENKLFFFKMDFTYTNLAKFLVSFDSLDSLTYDYIKRKSNNMNSLKSH